MPTPEELEAARKAEEEKKAQEEAAAKAAAEKKAAEEAAAKAEEERLAKLREELTATLTTEIQTKLDAAFTTKVTEELSKREAAKAEADKKAADDALVALKKKALEELAQNDPAKYGKICELANRGLAALDTTGKVAELFKSKGIAESPEVLKLFSTIGQAAAEDSFRIPGLTPPPPPSKPSLAERMHTWGRDKK